MLPLLIAAGATLAGNLLGQKNQAAINTQNMWAQNYQNELNRQAAVANQQTQLAHTQEINAQNIAFQRETNLANQAFAREQSALSLEQAARLNAMALADKEKDRALQQDFAQMGISWRVQDAERAGVHPLFALGGGGAAYSPSAISLSGGSFPSATAVAPQAQAASLGSLPPGVAPRAVASNSFANMGQDIGRAILSAQTQGMKNQAFETAYQDLTLKNLAMRNDLIASQIAKNTGAGAGKSATADTVWPGVLEVENPKATPLTGGFIMPGRADAQVWENRYDELGAFIGGAKNLVEDASMNPGLAYRWFQWANSQMISDQWWNYERARGAYKDYYNIGHSGARVRPRLSNPGPY